MSETDPQAILVTGPAAAGAVGGATGAGGGNGEGTIPTARVMRRWRGPSAAWLIPLMAAGFAAVLFYQSWSEYGPRVTILFESGNGISPNDPVTFRGVRVGTVHSVGLSRDLRKVRVEADLRPDAEPLAREGTKFWIVRPEVSLTRVTGLETLVGPRYIAAEPAPPLPTPARVKYEFDGLERPPHQRAGPAQGDPLEVVLRTERLGSITETSPVLYRDLKVGSVTKIALAPDGRRITVSVRIESPYAPLVRANTKFWNASGIGVDMGLFRGLTLRAESLETVLAGGIAFATPTAAGPAVTDGHEFDLEAAAVEGWQKWSPDLSAGGR